MLQKIAHLHSVNLLLHLVLSQTVHTIRTRYSVCSLYFQSSQILTGITFSFNVNLKVHRWFTTVVTLLFTMFAYASAHPVERYSQTTCIFIVFEFLLLFYGKSQDWMTILDRQFSTNILALLGVKCTNGIISNVPRTDMVLIIPKLTGGEQYHCSKVFQTTVEREDKGSSSHFGIKLNLF